MNTVLDVGILRDAAELRSQPRGVDDPGRRSKSTRSRVLAAEQHARDRDCVVSRAQLQGLGIGKDDIAREIHRGRWASLGLHTIAVHRGPLPEPGRWRRALHEVGSGGALDGVSSLRAAGLRGYQDAPHVSVPHGWQPRRIPGVVVKEIRDWIPGDIIEAGVRRVQSPLAAIRAANWARTDRQAALILVVVVQQGIVRPTDLFDVIKRFKRMRRRALIVGVLGDVLHGVQSLGELDFARECRRRGLPKPSRQVIRQGKRGRVYLDVYFDDFGLVIEIEGAHHDEVLNSIDDALRQNHLSRGAEDFLRIPVVGFRTDRGVFMQQVEDKLVNKGWRRPIYWLKVGDLCRACLQR